MTAAAVGRVHLEPGDEYRRVVPAPEQFLVRHILQGAAPAPPQQQVDGLLPDADIAFMGGPPGVGKTLVAAAIAFGVTLGVPVFGSCQVRRQCPTLLVNGEDGEAVMRMILDAFTAGADLGTSERILLGAQLAMVADDELVNLATNVGRLAETVRATGAGLLIIDPLINALPSGDEWNNDRAGSICDEVRRRICRPFSCTVLVTHHHRKRGRDQDSDAASLEDLRGASAWGAAARVVYAVSKTDETIRLTCTKANRGKPAAMCHDLTLAIESDADNPAAWTSCTLLEEDTEGTAALSATMRALTANERRALRALNDAEDGEQLAYGAWARRCDVPERSFDRCRAALVKAGYAVSVATGSRARNGSPVHVYSITTEGRNALLPGGARVAE